MSDNTTDTVYNATRIIAVSDTAPHSFYSGLPIGSVKIALHTSGISTAAMDKLMAAAAKITEEEFTDITFKNGNKTVRSICFQMSGADCHLELRVEPFVCLVNPTSKTTTEDIQFSLGYALCEITVEALRLERDTLRDKTATVADNPQSDDDFTAGDFLEELLDKSAHAATVIADKAGIFADKADDKITDLAVTASDMLDGLADRTLDFATDLADNPTVQKIFNFFTGETTKDNSLNKPSRPNPFDGLGSLTDLLDFLGTPPQDLTKGKPAAVQHLAEELAKKLNEQKR